MASAASKPKKNSKSETTHIVFVLDRSGSMSALGVEAVGGFNAFVEAQKALPGKARLTLIQFDHEYQESCSKVKLSEAPKLELGANYVPRGMTALLDAVGKAITSHQGEKKVLVAILTDGQENSSQEWKKPALRALIEKKQAEGWLFQYVSSDLNAFDDASSMGISAANTLWTPQDPGGMQKGYTHISTNTASYRAS
jgi:Mg-chelatase subunit ChlD